jgi:SAM-dependent methyltransferase
MDSEIRYGFGKNWQSFLATALDTPRIVRSAQSLRELLGCDDLVGKTFLDIGCGSGLFSLAACLLGARHVTSFDYDIHSVQASESLRAHARIAPERWYIGQGSVLDNSFMSSLAPADIVYSWGVLHHTGSMWAAIDQAAALVNPGGLFTIAIYNRVDRLLNNSRNWKQIKRIYNQTSIPARQAMEAIYAGLLLAQTTAQGQNPIAYIRKYSTVSRRGMDFWHDVRDWMGGYPYEYASPEEIIVHMRTKGMRLITMSESHGLGCNEFVFRRS